jgi:hypothetical protein
MRLIARNWDIVSVFVVTALILMLPLIGMQFSEDVDWKLPDFVIIGSILIAAGLAFVYTARRVDTLGRRLVLAAAFFLALLYIWAELAVGVIFGIGS